MNNVKKRKIGLFRWVVENPDLLDFSDKFFSILAEKTLVEESIIVMLFPGGIKEFVSGFEQFCDSLNIDVASKGRIRDSIKNLIIKRIK